ncbi:uncharacterized protein LOC103572087 isoform X1 [Microplitis demolitor]|uniref:uncharacterized protein LOC103572087 isoform X1 n=1 Tax=Microplitis demolitor TaxID=69319 RepID=UPI0004CD14EB|nr:uncharacterized protein LOC103572087 isoform X1 [Microplitis demolitor]
MADIALDDIIKKKKLPRATASKPNRGGLRNGPARGQRQNVPANRIKRPEVITDARMKIIQKNRAKLTDARDKLAEIAKQSDARLKLEKLRANFKKTPVSSSFRGNISRKAGRNGKLLLTTNKIPPLLGSLSGYGLPGPGHGLGHGPGPGSGMIAHGVRHGMGPGVGSLGPGLGGPTVTRTVNYRPPVDHYQVEDPVIDYQNDYAMEIPLRRTVNNEYASTPPPPPPVFNIKNSSAPTYLNNWTSKQPNISSSSSSASRLNNIQPSRTSGRSLRKTSEIERPRQLKVVTRTPLVSSQKIEPAYHDEDWSFETGSKSRTIINDDDDLNDDDDKYYSRSSRQPGVKSRLDSNLKSKPVMRTKTTSQTTGYRIVVSNLQAEVTQEDIKELFEDVGELLVSRLVRPGTAEVIYKTLKDATKAVETYHNRQLDGHPMKCLLVNPRPKNNPTAPAVRPLSESRRSGSTSYVQPSLGAVHRALFDDCHN